MKLMIASDLHGFAAYTGGCWSSIGIPAASGWCCWETCCPRPTKVLPEGYEPPLWPSCSTTWRISCCASGATATPRWSQMVLHFPFSNSALLVLDGLTIHATHGRIHGPDTPPPLGGVCVLCGHFHVPVRRDCGPYTYLNPGSVAPAQGEQPPQLHGGRTFTWLDVVTGHPSSPVDDGAA